ncbi:hypothetical protein [Microbacterium sp. NPDC096154]|uniref:hypothetical protein n=1 Tax=Microbacterium sp. NPDC096154 TaxID=3155549 RepID=UPI0033311670
MTDVTRELPRTRAGSPVLMKVRGLILTAVLSWLGYAMFTGGSRGRCYGEMYDDGSGGLHQTCEQWNLTESPLVGVVIAALAYRAVSRAARHALDDADAIRMLDRAGIAIMIVAGASLVIASAWFWMMPGPGEATSYIWPFPFGAVDVEIDPPPVP